jgi:hypothetical protein
MGKEYITDSIVISEGIIDGDGETGTGGQLLSSTGSGILWVDDNSVKPYTKTKLTANTAINNSTTLGVFSVINTSPVQNSGFTFTSSRIIPPSGGVYAVDVMAYYTSSSARVNVGLQVAVNNTFTGEEAAMGYIRASNGHNQSSLTWSSIVEVPAGGYISIGFVRLANAGTCTLDATKSAISVYKIS